MNKASAILLAVAIVAVFWVTGFLVTHFFGGTPDPVPPSAPDVDIHSRGMDVAEVNGGTIASLPSPDAAGQTRDVEPPAVETGGQHSYSLTPLSLRPGQATLAEVMAQLQPQMNARFSVNSLARRSRFTLDAQRLPFWEIVRRLSLQHPVLLGPTGIDQSLIFLDPEWAGGPERQQMLVQGPFMFYAHWMPPPRGRGNTPLPRDQRHRLRTHFAIDPRLTVLETQVFYEPLRDELGNVLYTPPEPRPATGFNRFNAQHSLGGDMQLTTPEGAGSRIPLWKIKARVVLGLESMEKDIADIQNHLNEPYELGSTTVTITSFETATQILMRTISTSKTPDATPYFAMEIFDKNDKRLMHRTSAGQGGAGQSFGAGAPFRLHLTVPQKTRELNLEFEIKDFALPND